MHGVEEFCEVFFDDVVVPSTGCSASAGDGWRLAMDLLPYERSHVALAPRRLPARGGSTR